MVPSGGGGGVTWINFCWICAAGLSEPLPHYKCHKSILWPNIDPISVTFRQICNFRNPNLGTLYFSPTEKHSGKFAHRKYQELSYPKNQKMCDPILVTLLKMQPHYSQSSRENATPSSGTSPLASYKEVPPHPRVTVSL